MRAIFSLFILPATAGLLLVLNVPFTPTTIANLFAWYDSSKTSSLTLSGSNVSGWKDSGPNGYNLTTSAFPTYNATGFNGYPTIQFSGSNQNLSTLGMGGTKAAFTIFSIISFGTSNVNFDCIWWTPNTAFAACGQTNDLQGEMSGPTGLNYYQNNVGAKCSSSSTAITTGTNYRLVHIYDGTTMQILLNNIQIATAAVSSARLGTNLQLGGQRGCDTTADWHGNISEMAFYSRALNTVELQELDNYGWQKWFPQPWPGNVYSSSLDGATMKTETPVGSFNYTNTTPWSMSLWLKPNNSSTSMSLFSHEEAANPFTGYACILPGAGASSQVRCALFHDEGAGNYLDVKTSTSLVTNGNTWTHVVITYSGSSTAAGLLVYFNGVSQTMTVTTDALTGNIQDSTLPLTFGYDTSAFPYYFSGNMDEISNWSVALTGAQVTALYNNGQPTNLTGSSNLVSWWRMGDLTDNSSTIFDQVGSNNMTPINFTSASFVNVVPTGQIP